jgi:hypothetical protein
VLGIVAALLSNFEDRADGIVRTTHIGSTLSSAGDSMVYLGRLKLTVREIREKKRGVFGEQFESWYD